MRSHFHHGPITRTPSNRRYTARPLTPSSRSYSSNRTRSEHEEIARASAAWEHEVARGLQAFVGQAIPLTTQEALRVTHVLNLAEDETFSGWYNWRGVTNPDMVVLGVLEGGPDHGATAAIAVDAKLSARSSKSQVMTDTLAQLLEPFQPLTNLVDSLLGDGASEHLALRNGFHVVRGVATTIGAAAKSTRALLDPEFAAEFAATRPVSIRPRHRRANGTRAAAPAERSAARMLPVAIDHTGLLAETIWSLDRWSAESGEMPEPQGVYQIADILALDEQENAPAEVLILGTHGAERVAQCVVLGPKRALPTADEARAFLAHLPGALGTQRYRVVPAFRVIAGEADTLPVLGNRRTVALPN